MFFASFLVQIIKMILLCSEQKKKITQGQNMQEVIEWPVKRPTVLNFGE